MTQMSDNIVLSVIGGLCTVLLAIIGFMIHNYERRITKLEDNRERDQLRIASIEKDITNRLASIEAKLEQLIER